MWKGFVSTCLLNRQHRKSVLEIDHPLSRSENIYNVAEWRFPDVNANPAVPFF
jgi:hypothetical protein